MIPPNKSNLFSLYVNVHSATTPRALVLKDGIILEKCLRKILKKNKKVVLDEILTF